MNETRTSKRRRRLWPWVVGAFALAAALIVAAAAYVVPAIIVSREWIYSADLAEHLPDDMKKLFANHTAEVRVRASRHATWDLVAEGCGRALDWPFSFTARINYSLIGLMAGGTGVFGFDGTDWRAEIRFNWSARKGWAVEVSMPDVGFNQDDALVGDAARRFAALSDDIAGLEFSGKARFSASASNTNGLGAATWEADAWIDDFDASLLYGFDKAELKNFRMHLGATGIGSHTDIKPAFPRIGSLDYAGIALSNAFVSVRSTEKAFLVTEAGADVWGGSARVYSCFLSRERLAAGLTMFLDNIDAGQALERLAGFNGTATGRLHGKLPLRYDGEKIAIGESYLYSTPGERGVLRMRDSSDFLVNLAYAGIGEGDRENMAKVLSNMSYDVLKISLRREDENQHALQFKLAGSATDGKTTVPALFDMTFHGDIPQIINIGLHAAKLKDKLQ